MGDLQERRIQVVRDHMRLEIEHDWEGVLATFEHPRYDINDGAAVFEGREEVLRYFAASRTPFPDQANEVIAIAADGDSVLVELWLTGTHLGPLQRGGKTFEPTGKKFRVRAMASFEFKPSSDKIVCERPYIDMGTIDRALGLT
ncbi:MAG TPA: nuclear transport factor 2 family protein [Rhizomicrobium sp.]|jgi:predicted ester cyclase